MKVTFVPSLCRDSSSDYTGTITMKMPTYDDRLAMFEEINSGNLAEVSEESITANLRKNGVSAMRQIAKKLPDFIVAVDIIRKSDRFKFDSFDVMQYEGDLGEVITECANKLVGKLNVQNPSTPH